jgi:Fic family protein
MKRGPTGRYIKITSVGEKCNAFIPADLPPAPPIKFNCRLQEISDRALLALGRLDGLSDNLPEPSLLLYMYIRKEAVLSSQIEGTQSTLTDLLLYENKQAPGVPLDDVLEISNYVAAVDYGLKRLQDGFPVSNRLFRDIHAVLLSKGRGSDQNPGEFRRSQNWIGGTRPGNAQYIPPPPETIIGSMSQLEKFIHDKPIKTPALIKAALSHVQFESIHPFLDGNGRLGRLLITLLLCSEGIQRKPMLYLSLYFKRHRKEYYDMLQKIRLEGDWELWLEFFFTGIIETSEQAVQTSRNLITLLSKDRKALEGLSKKSGTLLKIHQYFQHHPVTSIAKVAADLNLTFPTITSSLEALGKLGITHELTGQARNRIFAYNKYLSILSEGIESGT